jgi:hypothetical protein
VTKRYSLIVTDTSPLFTLALAGALDVLLRPGMPVRIPDAVYIEATRVHGAPGAEQIVEWINAHLDSVQIVPTDTGIDQQRRLEEGRGIRGLGEQAAVEALDRFLRELEAARLIQSTDFILDEAAAQGRNVERQRQPGEDSTTRERLREQLAREASQEQPTNRAAKKVALAGNRCETEQSIERGQERDLDRKR